MSVRIFLAFVLGLAWGGCPAAAQLDLRLESPQSSYLQYAPIPVRVVIKNIGGATVDLAGPLETPWFELIVQSNDGLVIRGDQPFSPPPLTLQPGESKTLPLDLAPHFLIREPGGYRVRASLRTGKGTSLMTEPLSLLIGRGEVVWTLPRGEGRERRIYTLLRYYEDPNVGLYLRVEVPEKNQVFASRRLGPYLPMGKPSAEFDQKNHLHILHLTAPGEYRLTVVNQDGALLREESRQEGTQKPKLRRGPDGLVDVDGGTVILPSHLREKLSTLQARAGTASVNP